jgi:hypothetical protein
MFENPVKWRKLGRIIKPRRDLWWMQTHASHPTAKVLDGTHVRIYVAGRDYKNRAHIGYVELDIERPDQDPYFSPEPVLSLGELGTFDDNGVMPLCVVDNANETLLYYIGWNPRTRVRMTFMSGLAISTDGGKTFRRHSRAPLLERTNDEPFLNGASCILHEADRWRMWYVAGTGWIHPDLPKYNIRYAESKDGRIWRRDGTICIDISKPGEHALGRPWVIRDGDIYRMWFAHKGQDYRLGYAESEDGILWQRRDDLSGIDVSGEEWASDMIEYCCVFEAGGRKYMLYNGNNYGHGGVGLAVEE